MLNYYFLGLPLLAGRLLSGIRFLGFIIDVLFIFLSLLIEFFVLFEIVELRRLVFCFLCGLLKVIDLILRIFSLQDPPEKLVL